MAPEANAQPAAVQGTDDPTWRATHGLLEAVTRAGNRLVAVGDRGVVLLSDDNGASWRRVDSGTDELLTAVLFTSPDEGWAVGQDSTILHTADSGLHWSAQFSAAGNDQALFSVASLGPNHLVATGAYALMLETTNANTWTAVKLPNLDEDYHLNCVMRHGDDVVVTGESGHAFVRHGDTWTPMPVPYDGSQFGCLAGRDGAIYSFGLRGSFFVSTPQTPAWTRIDTGEQRSLFGGTILASGAFALVGSNGLVMLYDPKTNKARVLPPPTPATLSGVAEAPDGKWAVVGEDGVHMTAPTTGGAEVTQ
jgi:photosystem II stability/assembly factor-like uncharacterized protein